jgi:hypothetical protein
VIEFTKWFTQMPLAARGLRCRQIDEADIEAVVSLLARAFPSRDRRFWLSAFAQLTRHETPQGFPKYGYLTEGDGVVVGVIVCIFTAIPDGDVLAIRCNLSCWYIEPAFRAYASMLVSRAIRNKDVTYLNVSPAPATYPIIEAQGFSRYSDGTIAAVPMLNGLVGAPRAQVFDASQLPEAEFDPRDQQILAEHASYGCVSLWCVANGRAYPFVFRSRLIGGVIPGAQLIYCNIIDDFVGFAGPVGRALARRGMLMVTLDANARLPGLLGYYRGDNRPKYFKGPRRPRLGDLAYTEYALMGV